MSQSEILTKLRERLDAFRDAERRLDFTTGEGYFAYDAARDALIQALLGEGDDEGNAGADWLVAVAELIEALDPVASVGLVEETNQ